MAALKYSRQRESIKSYLRGRDDHPTADMIHTGIRETYPNISLGTVYRNLSLLIKLGEVRKVTTDGADRFDANLAPHSHFICRECGRVIDVMTSLGELAQVPEAFQNIGKVEDCRMEFYGVCNFCDKDNDGSDESGHEDCGEDHDKDREDSKGNETFSK